MKRWLMGLLACGWTGVVLAEPGEFWEVTQKMEMPGMPMAMPETRSRLCLPKGGENDPRQSMRDPQGQCEMTDIKAQGNKVVWKVRCNQDGEVMHGSGEVTSSPGEYHGVMRLKGQSGGMAVDMTQNFRERKLGGSCSTSAAR